MKIIDLVKMLIGVNAENGVYHEGTLEINMSGIRIGIHNPQFRAESGKIIIEADDIEFIAPVMFSGNGHDPLIAYNIKTYHESDVESVDEPVLHLFSEEWKEAKILSDEEKEQIEYDQDVEKFGFEHANWMRRSH